MTRTSFHNALIGFFEKLLWKSNLLSRLYIAFFKRMTIKEFSIAQIPEDGKVLVIGCGSLPHTMIILGLEKNWRLTGIDIDKDAVNKAKSLVNKYKLKREIEIIEEDGLTVDLSGYDLIVISFDVKPKAKILERLLKDMDEKTCILYRTTWESFEKIYGKDVITNNAAIEKTFYRSDFIKSLILTRSEKR